MTHRIAFHDEWDNQIGWLDQDWYFLPEHIQVGQRYFKRTGKLGAYRYVEYHVHVVEEPAVIFA